MAGGDSGGDRLCRIFEGGVDPKGSFLILLERWSILAGGELQVSDVREMGNTKSESRGRG